MHHRMKCLFFSEATYFIFTIPTVSSKNSVVMYISQRSITVATYTNTPLSVNKGWRYVLCHTLLCALCVASYVCPCGRGVAYQLSFGLLLSRRDLLPPLFRLVHIPLATVCSLTHHDRKVGLRSITYHVVEGCRHRYYHQVAIHASIEAELFFFYGCDSSIS